MTGRLGAGFSADEEDDDEDCGAATGFDAGLSGLGAGLAGRRCGLDTVFLFRK